MYTTQNWESVFCPRDSQYFVHLFGPILANLGGQNTDPHVDKLLTLKTGLLTCNVLTNTGGKLFLEKHTQNKNKKGGQNTYPPQGVKVDKLLTLQHVYIYIYIYKDRNSCLEIYFCCQASIATITWIIHLRIIYVTFSWTMVCENTPRVKSR